MSLTTTIAQATGVTERQVQATIHLLDEGATVPFIARYRKERTGSLDEVAIAQIRDQLNQGRELEKRKEFVLKTIEDQEKLTPELTQQISAATTLAIVEDLYLPYKPRRRTKATVAREKGLEPLAELIFQQEKTDVTAAAEAYVSAEKEVADAEEALSGARDIMAEWISEDQESRAALRELFSQERSHPKSGAQGQGTRRGEVPRLL